MTERIFVTLTSSLEAKATLIWLPHAGGSAAFFQDLSEALPHSIECLAVEYSGRGRRINEPLSSDIMEAAHEIASAYSKFCADKPIILFGHSLGARIGFEVCRLLESRGSRILPKRLIVSACEPPHVQRVLPLLHRLPDVELVDILLRMGPSTEMGELAKELLFINIKVIRSDLARGEMHRFVPFPRPNQDLAVYAGSRDELVRSSILDQWQRLSGGAITYSEFEGGHFYMLERPSEFLARLAQDILGTPE